MTRRALLTGITGQDGWYLTELLLADGYDVFGVVRPGDPAPVPPGATAIEGDLTDASSLREALKLAGPQEVYNLAGISSVAQSWQQPVLTADINGLGLLRLIEAVRDQSERSGDPIRIVQASSAEIFGHAPAPQTEQTPIAPATPYGAAKALAQHLVAVYRAGGISISSAILYNHESPRRPATFVTRRITQGVARIARGSAEPLRLGNLEARRDWGFAGDYAEALRLIARHLRPDDFVVATGVSHSVADFVQAAFRHVGIDDWRDRIEVDRALTRPADPGEQRGDASKARQVLGWRPSVDFDQMVAAMVDADLDELG
jgi:GDPmannose 4,6-dehydratase